MLVNSSDSTGVSFADIICPGRESLDQLDGGFGGKIFVKVIVNLDHWCVDTGSEALDFEECEKAIFGRFAVFDAQLAGNGLDNRITTAASKLTRCL